MKQSENKKKIPEIIEPSPRSSQLTSFIPVCLECKFLKEATPWSGEPLCLNPVETGVYATVGSHSVDLNNVFFFKYLEMVMMMMMMAMIVVIRKVKFSHLN